MNNNTEINLKTLYTNKVIALQKFIKNEQTCTDEQYYELNDRCNDTARWFEEAVEREIKESNTHTMEVVRKMGEWDKFIATRINDKFNADLFKL